MESTCLLGKKPEFGLLVLGNVGVGKSYICNLMIGHEKFKSEFRREAVTTSVESHHIDTGSSDLVIYNMPGLIATDQEGIDRNKREIIKAFEQCPVSVVIFVWTHVDGRPQPNDVIAFKALQEAFRFSSRSLIFLVNNGLCKRPSTYEGRFLVLLEKVLDPMPVSLEDIFFLDTLKSEDIGACAATSDRLLFFIAQHQEHEQKMQADIIVRFIKLRVRREIIKEQYVKIEENSQAFECYIERMAYEYQAIKINQEKRFEDMMFKMEEGKQQVTAEDTDDEDDTTDSGTQHDEKKAGQKARCHQFWKEVGCEKGVVKKVERSYHIARTEILVIHKGNKDGEKKKCKPPCGTIENDNEKCDKTEKTSFKKIQKKFKKVCHVKCDCNLIKPAIIGGVAGAGLGGLAGAAVGGVAGCVLGPCAILTAAAGGAAGIAVGAVAGAAAGAAIGADGGIATGGIGGAIIGHYRRRRC